MCVLQSQERIGCDGSLILVLGGGQQVVDRELGGGKRDGGNLNRGGKRLQLLEVLMLLHQLVQQHLLLLLRETQRGREAMDKMTCFTQETGEEEEEKRGVVEMRWDQGRGRKEGGAEKRCSNVG